MAKEKTEKLPQVNVRITSLEVLAKMNTIAIIEGVTYNELYNLAFTKFVDIYEAKNGKVKARPKGKGLESL